MATLDPARQRLVLPRDWEQALAGSSGLGLLAGLEAFLATERATGPVHPDPGWELRALEITPVERVRVVIVGQDPYHGPGQAMGLAFSVPAGVPVPPSLRNIQAELEADVGVAPPGHGDLSSWAHQGVLLLNTTMTVREGQAGSHRGRGWETLSARVIECLSERRSGLVFMLWGRHAQEVGTGIARDRHLVLEAAHPSPLSARRGFVGCRHFSATNAYLASRGAPPVDWSLEAPPASSRGS